MGNTGNALDQIGVTQAYGDADDFEFDEVDSSIEVSPENSTECDQQVSQAASASGQPRDTCFKGSECKGPSPLLCPLPLSFRELG